MNYNAAHVLTIVIPDHLKAEEHSWIWCRIEAIIDVTLQSQKKMAYSGKKCESGSLTNVGESEKYGAVRVVENRKKEDHGDVVGRVIRGHSRRMDTKADPRHRQVKHKKTLFDELLRHSQTKYPRYLLSLPALDQVMKWPGM